MLDLLPHPCALFDRAAPGQLLEANQLFHQTFCRERSIGSLAEFEEFFEGAPRLGTGGRGTRRLAEASRTVRDKSGRWHLISRRPVWGPAIGKSLLLMAHDVTPMIERARSASAGPSPVANPQLARLTGREREVLERVIAGKLNKTIADELRISIKTVEMHRSNIMRKLGTRSVAELVRLTIGG